MTSPLPQGNSTIGRMCTLAGVSRAGFYRQFEASAPRQEETGGEGLAALPAWQDAVAAKDAATVASFAKRSGVSAHLPLHR